MADMYNSACTSSSSSPPEPDDFSLFLHQILLRSSQSSSAVNTHKGVTTPLQSQPNPPPYSLPQIANRSIPSTLITGSETQIAGFSSPVGNVFSAPGAFFQLNAAHLSSSSAGGASSYDPEEYDCDDSEEGFDGLAEETPARPVPPRGSSKRTRAAEVHNMSEKRRRSRINEKMKALQNLIPNSNKTDKASMLDEAIEYLKQLQLQVQMLTMKNGLSLYPMFHPGVLQQSGQPARMKMDLFEGNGLLNLSATNELSLNKNISGNSLFSLSNQCAKQVQPPGVAMPSILDPDSIFNQLHPVPSQVPQKEDTVAPQRLRGNISEANTLAAGSVPCNARSSDAMDNAAETGIARPESLFPSHLECDPIYASHLNE